MKKSIFFFALLCIIYAGSASGQGSSSSGRESEPGCACQQPELVIDLSGKFKLNYRELKINTLDDGSVLVQDRMTDNYYILKAGVTQGPFKEGDPKIAGFENYYPGESDQHTLLLRYRNILTQSGDNYVIKMGGKTYGPFSDLYEFTVSRSRDKFAALAVPASGGDGMPKLVTNIPNATFDIANALNAGMCANIKYDDILVVTQDKIITLQGKTLFSINPDNTACENLFVNTSNTKYAVDNFGTLELSDKTSLPDCFNPHLEKIDGKVFLAYMYYSPKRNAIMQCKIPF